MVTFPDGLREGLRSAACTLVGGRPEWLGQYLDWGTPSGLVPTARSLRRWVCDAPPDEEPTLPPPPFEGGQCPVRYNVTGTREAYSGSSGGECIGTLGTFPLSTVVWGPIGGIRLAGPTTCSKDGVASRSQFEVLCHGFAPVSGSPRLPAQQWVNLGSLGTAISVQITSVARSDGQPDDCGSLPPVLPPPGPVSIDMDITYGDNNEFNLTVPVIFAPLYVAIDGSINVPVTVQIDAGLELSGNLELFPDFEFSPSINFGGETGDGQPDPRPSPEDPDGSGESGEDSPDTPAEPGVRIYALLCRGRIEPDARPSGIFQRVGPDIYAPRLGSARFGTEIDGVTFWSEDIDIKGLSSVVQCPIPWGANKFVVNSAPGVSLNYAPISSAPKEWPSFIQLGSQFTSDNR